MPPVSNCQPDRSCYAGAGQQKHHIQATLSNPHPPRAQHTTHGQPAKQHLLQCASLANNNETSTSQHGHGPIAISHQHSYVTNFDAATLADLPGQLNEICYLDALATTGDFRKTAQKDSATECVHKTLGPAVSSNLVLLRKQRRADPADVVGATTLDRPSSGMNEATRDGSNIEAESAGSTTAAASVAVAHVPDMDEAGNSSNSSHHGPPLAFGSVIDPAVAWSAEESNHLLEVCLPRLVHLQVEVLLFPLLSHVLAPMLRILRLHHRQSTEMPNLPPAHVRGLFGFISRASRSLQYLSSQIIIPRFDVDPDYVSSRVNRSNAWQYVDLHSRELNTDRGQSGIEIGRSSGRPPVAAQTAAVRRVTEFCPVTEAAVAATDAPPSKHTDAHRLSGTAAQQGCHRRPRASSDMGPGAGTAPLRENPPTHAVSSFRLSLPRLLGLCVPVYDNVNQLHIPRCRSIQVTRSLNIDLLMRHISAHRVGARYPPIDALPQGRTNVDASRMSANPGDGVPGVETDDLANWWADQFPLRELCVKDLCSVSFATGVSCGACFGGCRCPPPLAAPRRYEWFGVGAERVHVRHQRRSAAAERRGGSFADSDCSSCTSLSGRKARGINAHRQLARTHCDNFSGQTAAGPCDGPRHLPHVCRAPTREDLIASENGRSRTVDRRNHCWCNFAISQAPPGKADEGGSSKPAGTARKGVAPDAPAPVTATVETIAPEGIAQARTAPPWKLKVVAASREAPANKPAAVTAAVRREWACQPTLPCTRVRRRGCETLSRCSNSCYQEGGGCDGLAWSTCTASENAEICSTAGEAATPPAGVCTGSGSACGGLAARTMTNLQLPRYEGATGVSSFSRSDPSLAEEFIDLVGISLRFVTMYQPEAGRPAGVGGGLDRHRQNLMDDLRVALLARGFSHANSHGWWHTLVRSTCPYRPGKSGSLKLPRNSDAS
eukprot:GHVT01011239.1.p1 GENE.GHVT01011239.1~~GHVT01011239.1.p1  ORF type:complete len:948 (+),score=103.27 GHVT01011239.1:686-3529(+)